MEILKFALSSIMQHKIRSFLTMLGIIIGVASVTLIVALGNGLKETLQDTYEDQMQNVLLYYNPKTETGRIVEPVSIKYEWLVPLNKVEGVKDYFATNGAMGSMIANGKKVDNVAINGIDEHFFNNNKIELLAGRLFQQQDYQSFSRMLLINNKLAEKLFDRDYQHALNQVLFINDNAYRIIGVYQEAKVTKLIEKYLPKETALMTNQQVANEFNTELIDRVTVRVSDISKINSVAQAAAQKLTEVSGIKEGQFESQDYTKIEKQMNSELNKRTMVLGTMAAISLVVGGIGIMNIMLVAVTERTREIGLRKALGATRHKIRIQFLIEASLLTLLGGSIGILLAICFTAIINVAFEEYIHASVSFIVGFGSLLFSALIGIVFGLLPANKASKLHPIEALRYE